MCDEDFKEHFFVQAVIPELSYGMHPFAVVSRFGLRHQGGAYGWHSSAIMAYCSDKQAADKVAEGLNLALALRSSLSSTELKIINTSCGRKVI